MWYYEDASIIPILAAVIIGTIRFKQLGPPLHYLFGLVVFELCLEVASRWLGILHRSNLFLLPLDTSVEFGLLAWIYRRALWPSVVSRWLPIVVLLFAGASLLSYADLATMHRFNTEQRFIESLLVLWLVCLYFYKTIRELVIIRLEREPLYWISIGLLLYFAGNVFIFVSSNYIIRHSEELSRRFWGVHAILYVVLNGLYAWALWIRLSNRK